MIKTYSAFYYGIEVTEVTQGFEFLEGATSRVATLRVGKYSLTDFASEIARAMNDVGTDTYTVAADRTSRVISISSTGSFTLLVSTGNPTGAYSILGFTGSDTASASSHTGSVAVARSYEPQFYLQSYVDFEDNQEAVDSTVLETASGQVETVKFGTKKIMECEIKFATDIDQGVGGYIRTNSNGVQDLRTFMQEIVKKGPLEFVPDKTQPAGFIKCILESTPESGDGVNFRLKENFSQGLIGYFETGLLRFRRLN